MTTTPTRTPREIDSLAAGFKRASIAAIVTVLVAFLAWATGTAPIANLVLLTGAAVGWTIYVLVVTVPGVIRLRSHHNRQSRPN